MNRGTSVSALAQMLALVQLELLRIWRDRKFVQTQLILPLILFPLTYLVMPMMLAQRGNTGIGNVVAISGTYAPQTVQALRGEGFDVREVQDAKAAVQGREVDVGLVGTRAATTGVPGRVLAYTKGSRLSSSVTAQRLMTALRDIDIELLARAAGVRPSDLARPALIDTDSASEKALGALGFLLVALIVMGLVNGVSSLATDLTGNAHERGEFISQLSAPVSGGVFYGVRVIVCAVAVLATVAWSLVVYQGVGVVQGLLGVSGFLEARALNLGTAGFADGWALLGMLVLSVALALGMSALAMTIGMWLRSAKGVNNVYGPVTAVVGFTPLGALIADNYHDVAAHWLAVPGVGAAVGQVKAMNGSLSSPELLLSVGAQLAFVALVGVLGARLVRPGR